MSRHARKAAWAFILLLSACSTMTFGTMTFGKRVIIANSIVESAAVTVERLIVTGALTPDEGKDATDQLTGAAAAIDLAEGMYSREPRVAGANLSAAIAGLEALVRYLEEKQDEHSESLKRADTQSATSGLLFQGPGDRRAVPESAGGRRA